MFQNSEYRKISNLFRGFPMGPWTLPPTWELIFSTMNFFGNNWKMYQKFVHIGWMYWIKAFRFTSFNPSYFKKWPKMLIFFQVFSLHLYSGELEGFILCHIGKAHKSIHISELHATQNNIFPANFVLSNKLHGASPRKQ